MRAREVSEAADAVSAARGISAKDIDWAITVVLWVLEEYKRKRYGAMAFLYKLMLDTFITVLTRVQRERLKETPPEVADGDK